MFAQKRLIRQENFGRQSGAMASLAFIVDYILAASPRELRTKSVDLLRHFLSFILDRVINVGAVDTFLTLSVHVELKRSHLLTKYTDKI